MPNRTLSKNVYLYNIRSVLSLSIKTNETHDWFTRLIYKIDLQDWFTRLIYKNPFGSSVVHDAVNRCFSTTTYDDNDANDANDNVTVAFLSPLNGWPELTRRNTQQHIQNTTSLR